MKKRVFIEKEVEVEEFVEWVLGMDASIECESQVERIGYKCAKLTTDVSIIMDIFLVVL